MQVVSELAVQREATADFIEAHPVDLVLTRRTQQSDNAGGYVTTETQLLVQRFALTGAGSGRPEVATQVGEVTQYQLQLVGYHTADIREHDTFTLEGGNYRVDFVYPERDYRIVALVLFEGTA